MNVLMVGVGPKRVGGMWTVAEEYISSTKYNKYVNLKYVSTSTNGSIIIRVICMLVGYIKILFLLHFYPIDIVHVHMAEKGSTFRKGRVVKWGKNKNKKVIIHLHAGPFMNWYDTLSDRKKKKICGIFSCSDKVFVLGEYWKEQLKKIVPKNKLIVLYNGIKQEEKNNYSLSSNNIVYFGVMNQAKGTYDLIKAIKKIDEFLPSSMKVILCGNDLEGKVEKMIRSLGIENRFILPGWVIGKTKERIYRNAMIDVLPSYFEGLSMTILEAMAKGIPVVTTHISTMPEVIGTTEGLVEPGDVNGLAMRILSLVRNPEKRLELSRDEFERINSIFSVDVFVTNTLKQYKRVLVGE